MLERIRKRKVIRPPEVMFFLLKVCSRSELKAEIVCFCLTS